jgi:hypothetical protein
VRRQRSRSVCSACECPDAPGSNSCVVVGFNAVELVGMKCPKRATFVHSPSVFLRRVSTILRLYYLVSTSLRKKLVSIFVLPRWIGAYFANLYKIPRRFHSFCFTKVSLDHAAKIHKEAQDRPRNQQGGISNVRLAPNVRAFRQIRFGK